MGRKSNRVDDISSIIDESHTTGEVKKEASVAELEKQVLKVNRENLSNFIKLFDILSDGIIIQDDSGNILYSNNSTEHITGIPLSSLKYYPKKGDMGIFDEAGRKINFSLLPTWALSQGKYTERIMVFKPAKGKKHWANVKTFPVYQKKKLLYVINILEDVTALKEKDDALLENKMQYKAFFENGLDGVFIVDDKERIISANNIGAKILGIPKKKMIGMDSTTFIHSKITRQEARKNKENYDKHGFWTGELEVERPDGNLRTIELWAKRNFIPGKTYVVVRDITEKNATKKALLTLSNKFKDQARTLEAILSSTTNHVYVVNRKGEYEYVNSAVADAIGMKTSEIVGKTGKMLGYPESFVKLITRLRNTVFETGELLKSETWFPTKDGERYFEFTINPIKDEKGKVILVVKTATDITERKLLEKKKDEFLGIASHELKTPLTSIKGYVQFLEKKYRETEDEESLHHILRVEAQVNRLNTLIADLLDVSRIGTGKMIFHEEKFMLGDLVGDIVKDFEYTSSTHTFIYKEINDVYVSADKYRIGQVLVNLISNALKYSHCNSDIVISMKKLDNEVVVTVKDFGIGIAKDVQEKIFERFYQLNLENGVKFSGLGLGLYISSQIIKRHSGRIGVRSTLGKGSEFYFTLPISSDKKS